MVRMLVGDYLQRLVMVNIIGKSFDAENAQMLARRCKEREDERESKSPCKEREDERASSPLQTSS